MLVELGFVAAGGGRVNLATAAGGGRATHVSLRPAHVPYSCDPSSNCRAEGVSTPRDA